MSATSEAKRRKISHGISCFCIDIMSHILSFTPLKVIARFALTCSEASYSTFENMTHAYVKDDELSRLVDLNSSLHKLRSLSCKLANPDSINTLYKLFKRLVGIRSLSIETNGFIFGSDTLERLFQLDQKLKAPIPTALTLRQLALPRSVLSTTVLRSLFERYQGLEDVILDNSTLQLEQNLRLFEKLPRLSESKMFFWACAAGNISIVDEMLLRRQELDLKINETFYGWNALLVACVENRYEVANMLICSGAHVNVSSSCGWRKEKEFAGFTPLLLAARSGNYGTCKLLLDAGADANYMVPSMFPSAGMTPLIEAAWGSHKAVVELLLQYKASSEAFRICDIQCESRYETGVTALHMTSSAAIAKIFIESLGMNPLAKDCVGWTPISFAAYRGWAPATLSTLLDAAEESGIDEFITTNSQDVAIDPRTPLVLAVEAGKVDAVETLVDREFIQDQLMTPVSGLLPIEAAALASISEVAQVRIISALQNAMVERFGVSEFSLDKNALMGKVLELFRGGYCSDCELPRLEGEVTMFQPMWKCTVCNGNPHHSAFVSAGSVSSPPTNGKGDLICSACAATCHTMCGLNGVGGQLSYHGHDIYKNCACHASSKCLFRHAGLLSTPMADPALSKKLTTAAVAARQQAAVFGFAGGESAEFLP